MMKNKELTLFFLFIIYSFIGWLIEVIPKSYKNKRFVNRGFLLGPICPIYGYGALFITVLLKDLYDYKVAVFILGIVITASLEYFTSYLLEKIFNNRWWDYSYAKYNINGRIRLDFSLYFGIFSFLIIYVFNQWLIKFINLFSVTFLSITGIALLIILIIDTTYSIIIAFNLRNRLIIVDELKKSKLNAIPIYIESKLRNRVLKYKLYPTRLLEAFPNLKNGREAFLDKMKNIRDNIKSKNTHK